MADVRNAAMGISIFPIFALLLVIYTAYEVHGFVCDMQRVYHIPYREALQIALHEIAVRIGEMLGGNHRGIF